MRSTLVLLAFLAFSCCAYDSQVEIFVNPSIEPRSFGLTGRIVNGTKAVPKQFPHQVSLRRSWSYSHFCGGSVISARIVLSAAHCMFNNGGIIEPWTVVVVGGVLKLNEESSTRQERGVESIKLHPKFNGTTLHNDVAIMRLSVPFQLTPEIRNVPLTGNPIVPGTICQVSGWGYTAESRPIVSSDLMYVDLPIRSTKECRELLINVTELPVGMYCAGYLEGGRDACQGDSGGGMVCNGVLTGVVSGGRGCAIPRLPGVYADIYQYIDWILQEENVIVIKNNTSNKNHDQNVGSNFSNNHNAHVTPTFMMMTVSFFLVLLSITS